MVVGIVSSIYDKERDIVWIRKESRQVRDAKKSDFIEHYPDLLLTWEMSNIYQSIRSVRKSYGYMFYATQIPVLGEPIVDENSFQRKPCDASEWVVFRVKYGSHINDEIARFYVDNIGKDVFRVKDGMVADVSVDLLINDIDYIYRNLTDCGMLDSRKYSHVSTSAAAKVISLGSVLHHSFKISVRREGIRDSRLVYEYIYEEEIPNSFSKIRLIPFATGNNASEYLELVMNDARKEKREITLVSGFGREALLIERKQLLFQFEDCVVDLSGGQGMTSDELMVFGRKIRRKLFSIFVNCPEHVLESDKCLKTGSDIEF